MEFQSQLVRYLLLFQVLAPWIGAVIMATFLNGPRSSTRGEQVMGFLLAVTSAALWLFVSGWIPFLDLPSVVQVSWKLPWSDWNAGFVDRVVWGIDPLTAGLLALLPWVLLTAAGFGAASQIRPGGNLLLLGSMGLFLVGWDLGSLLGGASATILALALNIARSGTGEKRQAAGMFLTAQVIGIVLLSASLAMFVSSAGIIRAAPHGVPSSSFTTLPELASLIKSANRQHPASQQLWEEYRGLPVLLLVLGTGIMTASFPCHSWLVGVVSSAALTDRIWLFTWLSAVFLAGLRIISWLDPTAMGSLGFWGLPGAVLGCALGGAFLLAQGDFPRLQASAYLWCHHLTLLSLFALAGNFERLLVPLILCQLAALVLFSVALTWISDRYRSIELASYQGLAARAPWLCPTLCVCLLVLTVTPTGVGLFTAWLANETFAVRSVLWGWALRLLLTVADLAALAGLIRVVRQLVSGALRLPEMSPGLMERAQLIPQPRSLELSRGQWSLLICWGVFALCVAILFPMILLFPPFDAVPAD